MNLSDPMMTGEEFEAEVIQRALDGDHEAGREALRLCRAGLDAGSLSKPLSAYLAERLWLIDQALDEADKLRAVKKSSGSIRSARDAAIAEALCIKKPAKKPRDPLPDWQAPYAAFGALLLKAGLRPEQVNAKMDEARRHVEGEAAGLERSEAQRIRRAYLPMRNLADEVLQDLAGPHLREILPTHLRQSKKT